MGLESTHSRRDRWVASLVRVQLAASGLAARAESPVTEDQWPALLMQAGAALIGVGGLLVVIRMRRQ
jgi:hypothetical protein